MALLKRGFPLNSRLGYTAVLSNVFVQRIKLRFDQGCVASTLNYSHYMLIKGWPLFILTTFVPSEAGTHYNLVGLFTTKKPKGSSWKRLEPLSLHQNSSALPHDHHVLLIIEISIDIILFICLIVYFSSFEGDPPELLSLAKLGTETYVQFPTDFTFNSNFEMVAIGFKNGWV